MKSFYQSYIRAFEKFAQSALDNSKSYTELGSFANQLNDKATDLLRRANLNARINAAKLQKDLFEKGKEYITKFAKKFRYQKPE